MLQILLGSLIEIMAIFYTEFLTRKVDLPVFFHEWQNIQNINFYTDIRENKISSSSFSSSCRKSIWYQYQLYKLKTNFNTFFRKSKISNSNINAIPPIFTQLICEKMQKKKGKIGFFFLILTSSSLEWWYRIFRVTGTPCSSAGLVFHMLALWNSIGLLKYILDFKNFTRDAKKTFIIIFKIKKK